MSLRLNISRFVQHIRRTLAEPKLIVRCIYWAPDRFAQRVYDFSGHPVLPNLSCSADVGHMRYIQSIYERPELRNPDTLIRELVPPPLRWTTRRHAKFFLSKFHEEPFYYYLIARTRYYDEVFSNAIESNIGCIVNIGCGSDTRAYRFAKQLRSHGIKMVECDQATSIAVKQQLASRRWQTDHVTYVSVDLNDNEWPDLEHRLDAIPCPALVMLEGVSPYIQATSFNRLLHFLVVKLHPGSVVAYDYKMQGFDVGDSNRNLFRLPATKHEVIAYHEALGYRVQHLELSSELSSRLLGDFASSHACSFGQDGLLKLALPERLRSI
jgi:methyltransferase (TIGR00027 family)